MFASGIWNPGEDHCYCPPGFLESLVFVVVFFFLIVFFSVPLTIFSCVSIIEGVAISDGVISFGVQDAMQVFNVMIRSSGLGKLPWFVSHCYGVVLSTFSFLMSDVSMILLVRVVSVVSIRESFSYLFLCGNHLFHCSSEFFIVSWVFFAEVLKLPPSHDSVRESFDYFSLCDVMYLSS